jgi:DegV family protein with EDD domain
MNWRKDDLFQGRAAALVTNAIIQSGEVFTNLIPLTEQPYGESWVIVHGKEFFLSHNLFFNRVNRSKRMSKVAVITDSTANIPQAMLEGLPITITPLQVIWDEHIYADGVDIHPDEFYARLKTAKSMPTTSQVTPQTFKKEFARLLENGYEILVMTLSTKLSGTLDSAIQAKAGFPGAPIELVDSTLASMALGFPVVKVAEAAKAGASLKECRDLAEKCCRQSGAFFAVNTLEYLRRGGRIGGAQAFLGTALNLKPVLKLENGRIEAVERVRTMSKAVDRLVDLLAIELDGQKPVYLASLHAGVPQDAQALCTRLSSQFCTNGSDVSVIAEVSPVLGTHTGPGTIAIAYMYGV